MTPTEIEGDWHKYELVFSEENAIETSIGSEDKCSYI